MHTFEIEKRYPEIEPTLHDVIEIMQRGFGRMESKFEEIDNRFDAMDDRFDRMDKRFSLVDKRFDELEVRFDLMDVRFDRMDKRFDDMDSRFDSVTVDVRDCQRRLGGIEIQIEDIADSVLNHEERLVKLEK